MKHTFELQLFTQLKKLGKERLKKIQAWTGFEPMTAAMPVSYQANWELVILRVRNSMKGEYMNMNVWKI